MTGVQTCALPICFPVTIGVDDWGYEHPGVVGVFAEMKDRTVIMIECIKEQHKDVINYWIPKMQELSRKYNIKVWNCDSARPEYIARGNRSGMRLVNARKEVYKRWYICYATKCKRNKRKWLFYRHYG